MPGGCVETVCPSFFSWTLKVAGGYDFCHATAIAPRWSRGKKRSVGSGLNCLRKAPVSSGRGATSLLLTLDASLCCLGCEGFFWQQLGLSRHAVGGKTEKVVLKLRSKALSGTWGFNVQVSSPPDLVCACTPQSLLQSSASEAGAGKMDEPSSRGYTVEDAITAVGFGSYQKYLLGYAGMAWMAEAMEMMLLSFTGPAVHQLWNLSAREESIISSVVFGGMMIGAYAWGVLSDLKGRRFGFFATAILTFVAGILSAASPNYYFLLLMRGLVGVGLGGGPVVSSWFMEFVPSSNRGFWMVVISLFWTVGSIAEASLAWAVMPTLGWRWLLAFSAAPLGVLLAFYSLVPESPRYLVTKGKVEEASKILESMARINGRQLPTGELVSLSVPLKELESQIEGSRIADKWDSGGEALDGVEDAHFLPNGSQPKIESFDGGLSVLSTILSPPLIRSTLILWSVFFANAFIYYGLVLLTSQVSGGARGCGLDSNDLAAASEVNDNLYRDVFVTSLAELPGLGVAAAIVDRLGRKNSKAMFFALSAMFLFPLIHSQPENLTTFLLFGARASIMGAFTVLYIYAPEVYPTSSRSTGLGIANSCARVGGLLCPLVAVDLVRNCEQSLAVALFTAVSVFASCAVSFLPVETTGKALSDDIV